MSTQQSKADHELSNEQLSGHRHPTTGNPTMNPRTLEILFCPVVAFAVRCKPAETKPADKRREGSRSSKNGTCHLAANVRYNTSVVSGNTRAPGQS
jgi:hypothetical protein